MMNAVDLERVKVRIRPHSTGLSFRTALILIGTRKVIFLILCA